MYILTNIEAQVTHKVLKGAGPGIDNSLPEPERKTLRDLIAKLGTSIDNGLPAGPSHPDNNLPGGPVHPDNVLPGAGGDPSVPDNTLPPAPQPKA